MARREDLMEALDAIETGMCRIKASRDIWQNELVYALCQAVRLLLTERKSWAWPLLDDRFLGTLTMGGRWK